MFAGRVTIITGASSGIGAGTAKHFASLGAYLILIGRNEENLKKINDECCALNNSNSHYIIADITNTSNIENIIEKTMSIYKRIDILINNAGTLEVGSIENTNLEQYDNVMNTNIRSIYYLTMLAVPYLIESKGTIVNVSSVTGIRAFPGVLAYCISKAAVDQFTRSIALELAPKGVRVNAVNPGVIITEIHKRGGMDEETYAKFLEHGKKTHALGRPGTVDEVAKTIAFLASSDSSFITGATIPVDGGRHAMVDLMEN